MELHDSLRICLLAIASRYPRHSLDINEQVLGPQTLAADGWTADDLVEVLALAQPDLLQKKARLVVNGYCSEIYLVEYSEDVPAFWLHCRGKIPPPRKHVHPRPAVALTFSRKASNQTTSPATGQMVVE